MVDFSYAQLFSQICQGGENELFCVFRFYQKQGNRSYNVRYYTGKTFVSTQERTSFWFGDRQLEFGHGERERK